MHSNTLVPASHLPLLLSTFHPLISISRASHVHCLPNLRPLRPSLIIRAQAELEAFPRTTLFAVVQRMTDAPVPLAHWTGYNAVVLVHAGAIRPWTVVVSHHSAQAGAAADGPQSIVFPRRWLDIYGRKLQDVWETALRAVLGFVLLRPGISQVCTDFSMRARSHTRTCVWLAGLTAVPCSFWFFLG